MVIEEICRIICPEKKKKKSQFQSFKNYYNLIYFFLVFLHIVLNFLQL